MHTTNITHPMAFCIMKAFRPSNHWLLEMCIQHGIHIYIYTHIYIYICKYLNHSNKLNSNLNFINCNSLITDIDISFSKIWWVTFDSYFYIWLILKNTICRHLLSGQLKKLCSILQLFDGILSLEFFKYRNNQK